MSYLSQSAFKVTKSDIGDLFIKGKFYIGDYAKNQVHLGFLVDLQVSPREKCLCQLRLAEPRAREVRAAARSLCAF